MVLEERTNQVGVIMMIMVARRRTLRRLLANNWWRGDNDVWSFYFLFIIRTF